MDAIPGYDRPKEGPEYGSWQATENQAQPKTNTNIAADDREAFAENPPDPEFFRRRQRSRSHDRPSGKPNYIDN